MSDEQLKGRGGPGRGQGRPSLRTDPVTLQVVVERSLRDRLDRYCKARRVEKKSAPGQTMPTSRYVVAAEALRLYLDEAEGAVTEWPKAEPKPRTGAKNAVSSCLGSTRHD